MRYFFLSIPIALLVLYLFFGHRPFTLASGKLIINSSRLLYLTLGIVVFECLVTFSQWNSNVFIIKNVNLLVFTTVLNVFFCAILLYLFSKYPAGIFDIQFLA